MQPPMPLFIGTALASLIVQSSAIAQVLACHPPALPDQADARDCFPRFGRTNQGNCLRLDACSLHITSNRVEFIYLLDGQPVRGWTNCLDPGWIVDRRYIPASSPAARSMLDYICRSRQTTHFR